MKKVLITGIAGGQGRLLTRRLNERFEVCGVDRARWEGHPRGVRPYVVDLRKKKFQDVIRRERPDCVVHMGFVQDFRTDERVRHDVNVMGTKQLLDHCIQHRRAEIDRAFERLRVRRIAGESLLPGRGFAPLSASRTYPEIRDLVEVDTLAYGIPLEVLRTFAPVCSDPSTLLGYYVQSMIGQSLPSSSDACPDRDGF